MTTLEYLKLNDVKSLFIAVFQHPIYKGIVTALMTFIAFGFNPEFTKAYYAIFALILCDCATAMMAAYQTGEPIKSSKFFRTPIKIMIYFGLIFVTHITGYSVPIIAGLLDETILCFLAVTELISIMENIHKMGYEVPNQLIKKLINVRDTK